MSNCTFISSALQEWHRKRYLKYLKGTKREAMSMAFDRARDQQMELINRESARITDKDRAFAHKWSMEREHAIAIATEKANAIYTRRMNRRFKLDKPIQWWVLWGRTNPTDSLRSVLHARLGNPIEAINAKLDEFRHSLNPIPRGESRPIDPNRKAKVVRKTNSAAVKLLSQFTDSLEAE